MTRIWIEFDQLEVLRERLIGIEHWQLTQYRRSLAMIFGKAQDKKLTPEQTVELFRDEAKKGWNERGDSPPMSQDDLPSCRSWADMVIEALKEKGDVR